jgi:hypothetical protein
VPVEAPVAALAFCTAPVAVLAAAPAGFVTALVGVLDCADAVLDAAALGKAVLLTEDAAAPAVAVVDAALGFGVFEVVVALEAAAVTPCTAAAGPVGCEAA